MVASTGLRRARRTRRMEPTTPTGSEAEDLAAESSILRTGTEAVRLQRRMERPARAGRLALAMIGTVTAAAGAATWVTSRTPLSEAITGFGGVLLALGVVQHFLYRRDQAHWPEQAHLWSDGVELVLHNGEVRGASWTDPDFSLQLIARRARPPIGREFVMIWLMDSKVPPLELSREGFERLRRSAANHGLDLIQSRRSSRSDATQFIHIHPSAAATAAARAKATGATGPD